MSEFESVADRIERHSSLSDAFEAGCLTVVVGVDERAAAACFGIDLADLVTMDSERWLGAPHAQTMVVQADDSSPVTAIFEDDGHEGSRAVLLERLSAQGVAASVFWNVNGMVIFSCARDGNLLWSGDVGTGEEREDLPRPLRLLDDLAAADPEADWVAIGAAMVEHFTEVDLLEPLGKLDLPWFVLTPQAE